MKNLRKILLASFLLLQVFSYLHLEEHGHGGEHEHSEDCEIVFFLNSFSADDSFIAEVLLPEFQLDVPAISAYQTEISLFNAKSYLTRAPPKIS